MTGATHDDALTVLRRLVGNPAASFHDGQYEAIEQLVEVYLRERNDGERFLDTFRRTGVAPFKEAVYAEAH